MVLQPPSSSSNDPPPHYQQLSRGYGFVTYINKEDSLRCKEALNNKYVFPSKAICFSPSGLPTQRKPVQIREAIQNYAEMVAERREVARKKKEMEDSVDAETKLFIGMISKEVDEQVRSTVTRKAMGWRFNCEGLIDRSFLTNVPNRSQCPTFVSRVSAIFSATSAT